MSGGKPVNPRRRALLLGAGTALAAADVLAAGDVLAAKAASHAPQTPRGRAAGRVTTLNGRSLPWRMRGGVKEFHLIAEAVEHEFAPGMKIKAWGYNGSTPGPTIEAFEGDRVRIYVTNRLPEHTSIHWHGILVPNGMDGVGGLTQPHIDPGETYMYEFTLHEAGTRMYHPHADEMVQVAMGMMGLFVIHPRDPALAVDRDFGIMLHNWAVHPTTWRPDPSVMTEFNLWTFNSKVFPAIDPMIVRTGQRVRIRVANMSMHDHPMHLHGAHFRVTGTDAGPVPLSAQQPMTTTLVPVGGIHDIEFVPRHAGDWSFHCHKSHHTMNTMGHDIPNPLGVKQSDLDARIAEHLPGYFAMGENGMAEHQMHTEMGHHEAPENTLPMMAGKGPYGNLEMGGMFTLLKVRDRLASYADPGWYAPPAGSVARRISDDPDFKL